MQCVERGIDMVESIQIGFYLSVHLYSLYPCLRTPSVSVVDFVSHTHTLLYIAMCTLTAC